MIIREQIEEKLKIAFNPIFLEVINESDRHKTLSTLESHFKILLVSDYFSGQKFLNRHRMIYRILSKELSRTVHALALHIYTDKEWKEVQKNMMVCVSPACCRNRIPNNLGILSYE